MDGLMMDYQLTVPAILRRAETFFGHAAIVSRSQDRSIHRSTYAEMSGRAKQLATALAGLGVRAGDRVGTLAWNHHQHVEAYFAVPAIGAVLHTVNLRLHPGEIRFIVHHAADRFFMVDKELLPLLEQAGGCVNPERVIVMAGDGDVPPGMIDYERLVAGAGGGRFEYEDIDERSAAAMCYTSGTTGRSKGTVYSHRAIVIESMNWTAADTIGARQRDVMLAVVPMFHINGWGLPFTAAFVGAKLVLPGPHPDAASLLQLIESEGVTLSAGVPTVWLSLLQFLESHPRSYDISSLRTLVIGGSAVPEALVRNYRERFGVRVVQAWGMTETTSVATVCPLPVDLEAAPAHVQDAWCVRQGVPMPFVEIRARSADELVPWDGKTMGELEVRGPTVARAYYNNPAATECFTADGWLRTGDIVTIEARGCIQVCDRSKDLIKSGGEWISSVALENALMGHPSVSEAAVIAVPHPQWDERPLAVIVLKPGQRAGADELRDHLLSQFVKWWVPDAFEFVDTIPRTSTGKFLKSALRQRFAGSYRSGT